MTVKEILQEYLETNGFDGLYNEWSECGCKIYDLSPGDCMDDQCEPGYNLGEGMIGRRQ